MTGFSLKDHLFNADSLRDFSNEISNGVAGFDGAGYQVEVLAGFPQRGLLERLEWMADCLEPRLSPDFSEMADQLEASMPPPLDPSLTDDDFGRFIHAVPGILAVRHGLEAHRERALDLLHEATQRFSMEFYIRPFLNRWPEETLCRLALWARDENYHVRRLVSEGTRPKLPWAKAVNIPATRVLPLLDQLHADSARYVTRSVSNHLNDIAKTDPDLVLGKLEEWADAKVQDARELHWMTRHALRVLVKKGHPGSLAMLGYDPNAAVEAIVQPEETVVRIGGELRFHVELTAPVATPVLVDYVIWFNKAGGAQTAKVFKLKQVVLRPNEPMFLRKAHKLKGDATTFRLHPGAHRLGVQVNGVVISEVPFSLLPPE